MSRKPQHHWHGTESYCLYRIFTLYFSIQHVDCFFTIRLKFEFHIIIYLFMLNSTHITDVVVDHETRRGFLQRSQCYLEHTCQSSASGISSKKDCCCSNVRYTSTASLKGNSGDAIWSDDITDPWNTSIVSLTTWETSYLKIQASEAVSFRLWCSYAHSIETTGIRKMLQNAPYFPRGAIKLHFPNSINTYSWKGVALDNNLRYFNNLFCIVLTFVG